ncbi:MAG: hypothetical protein JWR52_3510 [Marmoricola sp.]|nr:hypothetical protein [Marmoricola sp.]
MLALAGAVVPLGPARAASGPFSIDGVVPDTTPTPPQLSDAFGNVKEIGPMNASTTKIGVIQSAPTPMLALTNPNAQVDLRRAWLTTAKDTATGHDWLYFAWERDSNSGSGFIAYEFMQNAAPAGCAYGTATDAQLIANCNPWANRRAGDFMILWDQSGSSTALVLRTWSADSAGHLTLGAGVPLDTTVSQAAFSPDGYRGEAAVDLTATIFGGSNACKSFANTIPSTVTGNSDSADYKDTILQQTPPITNCTATIATTPKTSTGASIPATGLAIGSGAVGVTDSAVVGLAGGSATPSGSVSFTLCKVDAPATCSTGGTAVGSTSLTGGSYPATVNSPTAYVTSAGRYCWRSSFSGDTANGIPSVTESSSGECFTVNPATPAVATTAGPTQLIGQPVTDSASLTGTTAQPANPVINLTGATGSAAGGTITFLLYGPSSSGCGSLVYTSPTVAVHGDGSYGTPDPQFVPTQAGTYHWVANYSGSSPNTNPTTHNTVCDDAAEDVTVTTVASTLSTAQTWVPNDSITVSAPAGGTLAGTAYFDLFGSSNCSGTALYSTSSTVGGLSPQTVGTSNTTPHSASGPYSWQVRYDSTNPAQRSIPATCQETSALTVTNGGSVSSP